MDSQISTEIGALRMMITARESYEPPTPNQVTALIISVEECLEDPCHRHAILSLLLGRDICTQKQMTKTEHSVLLQYLRGTRENKRVIERGKLLFAGLEDELEALLDEKSKEVGVRSWGDSSSLSDLSSSHR